MVAGPTRLHLAEPTGSPPPALGRPGTPRRRADRVAAAYVWPARPSRSSAVAIRTATSAYVASGALERLRPAPAETSRCPACAPGCAGPRTGRAPSPRRPLAGRGPLPLALGGGLTELARTDPARSTHWSAGCPSAYRTGSPAFPGEQTRPWAPGGRGDGPYQPYGPSSSPADHPVATRSISPWSATRPSASRGDGGGLPGVLALGRRPGRPGAAGWP